MAAAARPASLNVRAPASPPFEEEPLDMQRTRATLAYLLLALFAVSLIGSLIYIGSADDWTRAKEFLQIALPAEIGLLGGAIGFYFGSQGAKPPGSL